MALKTDGGSSSVALRASPARTIKATVTAAVAQSRLIVIVRTGDHVITPLSIVAKSLRRPAISGSIASINVSISTSCLLRPSLTKASRPALRALSALRAFFLLLGSLVRIAHYEHTLSFA